MQAGESSDQIRLLMEHLNFVDIMSIWELFKILSEEKVENAILLMLRFSNIRILVEISDQS